MHNNGRSAGLPEVKRKQVRQICTKKMCQTNPISTALVVILKSTVNNGLLQIARPKAALGV